MGGAGLCIPGRKKEEGAGTVRQHQGTACPTKGVYDKTPGTGHAQSEMKCTILLTVFQNAIKGSEHAPARVLAAGRGVK